jgi:phosphotransferase system HPr (HPr) family protein
VKVRLPDALHARPANLLVRLAAQHDARVRLKKGGCGADARKILDVLALGAARGDEIEIVAEGEGAEAAVLAIAELVARNFDADLVPERGSGAVEGIAIGRALVVLVEGRTSKASAEARRTVADELTRLASAEVRALAELGALIASLDAEERPLFEPELAILRELAGAAQSHLAGGMTCEEAITALTASAPTDLILDARARFLEALSEGGAVADALARACELGEEVIVVAEMLTPSLVARLPARVHGIVAVDEEPEAGRVRTSHAAILARGRELPLAMVPSHVALGIVEGDLIVVDTTDPHLQPARVWVAPSDALVVDARARRSRRKAGGAEVARLIAHVAGALGVALLVNVGSLHDRVPEGVAGVGLLRTELLFAGKTSAPSELEQVAALLAVGRAARGAMVTARLWDAGGDKPLAWLPSTNAEERGAALLFAPAHRAVLETQLAAIARAAERTPLRVLIPMTRTAADVAAVRRVLAAGGGKGAAVQVGAMIETPEAARAAASIAAAADFVCIGTNDLASLVLGVERTDAHQALAPQVLALIARVVEQAHAASPRKSVTVCGEVAADPRGARILIGLGVDALSVAPPRLADTVRALEHATLDECRLLAREAGKETRRPEPS